MKRILPSQSAAQPARLRRELLALGAITLVGAFLRLYRLDSFPPGLHFDEAVYGLQGEYIYQGHFPVFFQAYTGREPFYMYLVALVYLFTGPNTLGLRLTSALIGILTIPAAYLALRELCDRRVALIGALLTAISYWHFNVTRTGFCWTLMPLVESLAIYLLWRGYRRGELWSMALGGAATASALYIYLAARFFPPMVVLGVLYLLLVDRKRLWSRRHGLVLACVVALVVFAPLGWHYLRHPHDFWERADQVLAWKQGSDGLRRLADNVWHILPTFLPRLSTQGRYSLQGRPAFDPLIGPFFLLGLGLALWRWRRPENGLLVLWWLVMALPPVFTVEPYPVSQRIFGVIPAIYGLAALGLAEVYRWLGVRPKGKAVGAALLGALLLAEGVWSGSYYFTIWAPAKSTYYHFHSDVVAASQVAQQSLAAGRRVVFASEHHHHPSAVFTAPATVQAKWVQGRRTVVLPAWDGREIDYIVPIYDAKPIGPAVEILQALSCAKEERSGTIGDPVVEIYHLCQPPAVQRPAIPRALLGDEVILWQVDVPASARRDEPLRVALRWQVRAKTDAPRSFAVHVVDAQGVLWAQVDELGFIPSEWEPGDEVWQWLDVPLPAAIPPGAYEVRLLFAGENATPLLVRGADGAPMGIYLQAGQTRLTSEGRALAPVMAAGPQFSPLRLALWQPVEAKRRPGEKLLVAVTWQKAAEADASLEAELSLQAADGTVAARWRYPLAGEYPVMDWQVGELVEQRYLLALPAELAPGDYSLLLGLAGRSERWRLGAVRVAGLSRLMTPPPMQHAWPTPATLGTSIQLLGYDLDPTAWQGTVPPPLTLYWRAGAPVEGDYTVFVHLLNERGEIVSQQDVPPAEGQRPTSGWLPEEVIVDRHLLPPLKERAPGEYTFAVGLYDPHTMARLELRGPDGTRLPDDRLLLGELVVE